jgi:hypothetical protein
MDIILIPVFILVSLLVPVLALALLLYAVPVRVEVRLVWKGDRREQVLAISWCHLGIRSSGTGAGRVTKVLVAGHAVLSHTGQGETGARETPGEDRVPVPPGTPGTGELTLCKLVPVVQRVIGPAGAFGSVCWHESRFVDARGTVTLGLGDPVLTGEVCGFYWASRFLFQACRVDIELEPVFDRTVLELDITLRMKVARPLLVLVAGLQLARDPSVTEAVDAARGRATGAAGA